MLLFPNEIKACLIDKLIKINKNSFNNHVCVQTSPLNYLNYN